MSILLNTPLNPGDLDPGVVSGYQEVKILSFKLDTERNRIELNCAYGNTVSGIFKRGIAQDNFYVITNSGYQELIASGTPEEGETIYEAAGRELYEWLLSNGYFLGTIQ